MSEIIFTVESDEYLQQHFTDQPETDDRRQLDTLVAKHHDEIVVHKGMQQRDPDFARYRELAKQKRIFGVQARVDGKIVGYALIFVQRHLHDRNLMYAMDDVYFIDPECRAKGLGSGLFQACEDEAKRRGAKLLLIRTKKHKSFGPWLEHRGYSEFEAVYAKEL